MVDITISKSYQGPLKGKDHQALNDYLAGKGLKDISGTLSSGAALNNYPVYSMMKIDNLTYIFVRSDNPEVIEKVKGKFPKSPDDSKEQRTYQDNILIQIGQALRLIKKPQEVH